MTTVVSRAYTCPVSQESAERRQESAEPGDALDVADDQLPDDLQPTDDNPLARPADDDVPDDLLAQDADRPSSDSDSGGDSEGASGRGAGDASDTSSQEASFETESNRAPAAEPEDSVGG